MEVKHAVHEQYPGCPLCADDNYASGRKGCCRAAGLAAIPARGDCSDQCHADRVYLIVHGASCENFLRPYDLGEIDPCLR